jgi:putative transposase
VIESWHSTLEFELRSLEHFAAKGHSAGSGSRPGSTNTTDRRHSALQMRSPVSYELYLPADTEAA